MGATNFFISRRGKTAQDAFLDAKDEAAYENGHGGYTGTIAEKDSFVIIPVPEGRVPLEFARELARSDNDMMDDKWGPACCVQLGPESWCFFGSASD